MPQVVRCCRDANGHTSLTGCPVGCGLSQVELLGAKERICHPARRAWEADAGLCVSAPGEEG